MKLKFITLNVEHGGELFENIVRFIEKEEPDILTLQEVYDSNLLKREKRFRAFSEYGKSFNKFLPFSAFQSSSFFTTEIEEGAEIGNAVYSRFKILENEKTQIGAPYGVMDEKGSNDFSMTPRMLQQVLLLIDGKKVNLFNLHGVWGFDGFDSKERIEMANIISSKIKGKENVILAGDTNFNTTAIKTIEIIENSGVKSVFKDTLKSTFNMDHKTDLGYASAAVDMIFMGPEFKVLKKELMKVDVSDHYPLMVELEI